MPLLCKFRFPHEDALYIMNLLFLLFEVILGIFVMIHFSNI